MNTSTTGRVSGDQLERLVVAHRRLEASRRARYSTPSAAVRLARSLAGRWVKFNPILEEAAAAPELATPDMAAALVATAATWHPGMWPSLAILRALPRSVVAGSAQAVLAAIDRTYANDPSSLERIGDVSGAAEVYAALGLPDDFAAVVASVREADGDAAADAIDRQHRQRARETAEYRARAERSLD